MVQRHNDPALETLTSKGLLRRARRDFESGKARLEAVEAEAAVVSIDGHTVKLDAKGPLASSCDCKAHGVCRHILAAILLLRQRLTAQPDESAADREPEVPAALAEICSLDDRQVKTFAGADLGKAAELALENIEVGIEDEGVSVTLRMAEMNAAVTFIAGNGLKGAAYKGPKTRQRLLVTLAALMLRRREGIPAPADAPAPTGSREPAGVSSEFIAEAELALERAVAATLPSRSPMARDLLLDLAISSRCEALPRLSAELKALATQAKLASERSIEFEPGAFLLDAARSYALLKALSASPADPALIGVVRRDYRPSPGIDVWPLAASRWRSRTGARGLTGYVLDPAGGRWLTVLVGRSAGVDTAFETSQAYEMPMWGAGTLRGLMGRRVRLPEPSVAPDGSLSAKPQGDADVSKRSLEAGDILGCSATHANWQALKSDLAARLGSGVRRRSVPLPALIAPASFGRVGFDDMSQAYHWELYDDVGDSLVLTTPAADHDSALRLWQLGKRIQALVIEARPEKQGLEFRPVSVLLQQRGSLFVHNVDFDDWPDERGLRRALSKLGERVAKPLTMSRSSGGQVESVLYDAAEELVGAIGGSGSAKADATLKRIEACGLVTLGAALETALAERTVRSALRAGYVASELRALAMTSAA